MQSKVFFEKCFDLVENYLDKLVVADGQISDINEAVRYSLLSGGKRVRPMMFMATIHALGKNESQFLPVAAGLEMIHTYSLVHDDLPAMDDDDYRRGRLTNHKVYGEAKAILAGDALLTKAFEVMLSQEGVCNKALVKAVKDIAFYAGDCGMIGGQTIDLEAQKNIISIDALQTMHTAKTGALFKAAILSAARLADASDEQFEALEEYAQNFGLTFQITDDILDVTGNLEQMGKSAGSDEKKGKCTYVSTYGLDKAQELAKMHVQNGIACLQMFGDKSVHLQYLIKKLINRNN